MQLQRMDYPKLYPTAIHPCSHIKYNTNAALKVWLRHLSDLDKCPTPLVQDDTRILIPPILHRYVGIKTKTNSKGA